MTISMKPLPFLILLIVASGPAAAQSSIVFRNTSPLTTIPLEPAEPVVFSADQNNLVASCLLQTGTTVCQGVGQQTNAQVPAITLSPTGLNTDPSGRYLVDSGVQFPVRRQVTNSPHVCVATSTPATGVVGWDNAFTPGADTSVNVRLSGSGEVTLRYRCYNEAGAAPTATSLVFLINAPVGPNPDACSLPSNPNINPAGFIRHVLSWNDLFGTGPFPGYTTRSPVGSYTIGRSLPGPLAAGMFITVPITVEANRTYTLRHYPAQYVGSAPPGFAPGSWYPGDTSREGAAFVSISPCAGDLRPYSPSPSDPWLRRCRTSTPILEGPFQFTTGASPFLCELQAGQTYWLTYAMVDPDGGLTTTEDTCRFGRSCETTIEFRSEPAN